MIFPEFYKNEVNSMKPSKEFLRGFWRRLFKKKKVKVFVIGFHKTGTSSYGKALQRLGYKVCGSLKEAYDYESSGLKFNEYLIEKAKPLFEKYDAFQDTPWFLLYRELYVLYPDAKFILTTRVEDRWLKSMQGHFKNNNYPYHKFIYADLDMFENPEKFIEIYKNHNNSVREFFKDKKNQFLELELTEEGKFDKICDFIEVDRVKEDFPHVNKISDSNSLKRKTIKIIKKLLYK